MSRDILSPEYGICTDWIDNHIKGGKSWNFIKYISRDSHEEAVMFWEFQKDANSWPKDMTIDDWYRIVEMKKETYEEQVLVEEGERNAILKDENQDNSISLPSSDRSSWKTYKKHLEAQGWKKESVDEIESASLSALKRLSSDTRNMKHPIKGLVVGQVQSGKTANMAGLMAMAADHGWNMFIILSGMVINLNKQTEKRLLSDLKQKRMNIKWHAIDQPDIDREADRLTNLHLDDTNNRYFTVCIKNQSWLKKLIRWMRYDLNRHRLLKVLIIDDEADQASVNTGDIEDDNRKTINKLLIDIVEQRGIDKEKHGVTAMNYISYTATPYANILNETSSESLYPKNFIQMLKSSNEYFGPEQIFGYEEAEGMDIVRTISDTDFEDMKDIHDGEYANIPKSLEYSICWFLCGAATIRYWGNHDKPVSMLIHTSYKQEHHTVLSELVSVWIESNYKNGKILTKCRKVWEEETRRFNPDHLKKAYPNYNSGDFSRVNDFPKFKDIEDEIKILSEAVTSIVADEENDCFEYEDNIHLCIDNSDNYYGYDEKGNYRRLIYPNPERDKTPPVPAFIVIGGNTLSRGLTIEGLISTYFLRNSAQADSLMQMGRWFGYRKGYETVPRIWMTDNIRGKFEFLSSLESELREDLRSFSEAGKRPDEYGPKIKNSPKASWIRVTAKNKMQSAVETDLDFSGNQEQLIIFDNDEEILKRNIDVTEKFLNNLKAPEKSVNDNSIVYRDVPFNESIKNFLKEYTMQKNTRVANQKNAFIQWIDDVTSKKEWKMDNWNIIVSGTGKVDDKEKENGWNIGDFRLGKVKRTRLKSSSDDNTLNIGALLSPADRFADIPLSHKKLVQGIGTINRSKVDKIRKQAGVDKTPIIVIYMIDKNSANTQASSAREDLNAKEDIAAFYISIPGIESGTSAKSLTVKTKQKTENENWER